jgi:hypothetical protein
MNRIFKFISLILLCNAAAMAQPPRTISYQGVLADAAGNLVADGNHSLTIRLYEQASGGTAIYEESQSVIVTKGVFTMILGTATSIPDSLTFDRAYFLGVGVDGGPELVPRTAMTSAPYALHATHADIATAVAPGAEIVTNLNGGIGPLTLKGSGGTTINRTGDTITIASTEPSGATGIQGLQNNDGSIEITNPNGPIASISVSSNALPWTTIGTTISNTNSGNVGIGTTTPATKLEVNGTTRTRDLQITSGAASGRMLVSNASGTATWTTDMKIVGGNVGIGDTTPKGKLHVVAGNSGFDPTFVRSMVLEEDGHLTLSLRGPTGMEQSILFERPVGDTGLRISSQPDGDMRIGRYRFTDNGSASSSFQLFLDVHTGNFGIGRDPVANDLEVDGTASKTAAGDWLANSDRRIKTDIADIGESFKTVLKLHPVKFRYSKEWMRRNHSIENRYYYNFIAQEYRQVFPDAVKGSGEYLAGDPEEILQIDTYDAQIVTIKAVQELIQENATLKEHNGELLSRIERIEASLLSLQSIMGEAASLQK